MSSNPFTATLLRTSAGGFAAVTVSRTLERSDTEGELNGGFGAWQAHFQSLVMELAAAIADGSQEQFATRVGWTRDAFIARGHSTEILRAGLEELGTVLEESLPSAAWQPLPGYLDAAKQELDQAPASVDRGKLGDDPLDLLAREYLAEIRKGESARAIDVVESAIRDGRLSVNDALARVLTGALREIGWLWHTNLINIAEEHFATQTTGRLLERIVLMAPEVEPFGRTVILTMVEGDTHDIGLRIVAALFELDGWRTICLGANTPAADLALLAEAHDADLVVVGATLNVQREAAAQSIEALRQARPEQKVLVGGPAFAGFAERSGEIGANGCAVFPRDAVRLGRELVEA